MNREVQFCFAIPRSEPFPPVKRSSPIHSFAIHDILGLGEKNSKPKESSPQNPTLVECFSPIASRLENPSLEAEKTTIISGKFCSAIIYSSLCEDRVSFNYFLNTPSMTLLAVVSPWPPVPLWEQMIL